MEYALRHYTVNALQRDTSYSRVDDVVDRRGDEIFYWRKNEGQWYHVYDVAASLTTGKMRRVRYESRRVTHRIFVVPAGHQWRYTFGRNEVTAITAAALARQREAGVFHHGRDQRRADPR